jgi:hypothetical protein
MPLPTGTITMGEVNTELGRPSTQTIDLNDSSVRTLAQVGGAGTVISMNNLRGKSSLLTLTIASDVLNYNLYTAATAAGWSGQSIQLNINSGVTVGSASTGSYALSVPSSLGPAPTITIVNNGTVIGAGGAGGAGGPSRNASTFYATPGGAGTKGGDAILVQRPAVISNSGVIAGGGGGGGGGGSSGPSLGNPSTWLQWVAGGGGGGGAGSNVGAGGAGGTFDGPVGGGSATAGSNGTSTTGGAGGPGRNRPSANNSVANGGAGGGRGASGVAGNP